MATASRRILTSCSRWSQHRCLGESLAAVLDGRDERPLVYVTFGTAFNTPDLFQQVFDALAIRRPGDRHHRAQQRRRRPLGPRQCPNGSVPLAGAHPRTCRSGGRGRAGYGSLTGALRRGLPILSLPLAPPDNRFNAARLVELGAGLALRSRKNVRPMRFGSPSSGCSTSVSTANSPERSLRRLLRSHQSIMRPSSSNGPAVPADVTQSVAVGSTVQQRRIRGTLRRLPTMLERALYSARRAVTTAPPVTVRPGSRYRVDSSSSSAPLTCRSRTVRQLC